jgi:hypothetical protein
MIMSEAAAGNVAQLLGAGVRRRSVDAHSEKELGDALLHDL